MIAFNSIISSVLAFFVFVVLVYGARDEPYRNTIHYTPERYYMGRPVSILTRQDSFNRNILYVIYRTNQQDLNVPNELGLMEWKIVSSEDGGIRWSSPQVLLRSINSAVNQTSYYDGSIYAAPQLNPHFPYLLLVSARVCPAGSTSLSNCYHAIQRKYTNLVTTTDGLPFDLKYFLDPNLFRENGNTYFAAVQEKDPSCTVSFFYMDNHAYKRTNAQLKIDSTRPCRAPQIFRVGTTTYISATFMNDYQLFRTYIQQVSITANKDHLTVTAVSPLQVFDGGNDASSFAFGFYANDPVAIGWNSNYYYERVKNYFPTEYWLNGLTLIRKLSVGGGNTLYQEVPKYFTNNLGCNCSPKALTSSDRSIGTSEFKYSFKDVCTDKSSDAFYFDLTIPSQAEDPYVGSGVQIKFFSSKKKDEYLTVEINPGQTVNKEQREYRINRSQVLGFKDKLVFSKYPIQDAKSAILGSLKIFLDKTTIEVYAENGRYVMTENYFVGGTKPEPFDTITIVALGSKKVTLRKGSTVQRLGNIWSSKSTCKTGSKDNNKASAAINFQQGFWSSIFLLGLFPLMV